MIYVDSSVALVAVLAEERQPPEGLWSADRLTSSRLLEYEVWNRAFARGIGASHASEIRALLRKIDLVDLTPDCLRRALRPFPVAVRTLDGLHLATLDHLVDRGEAVALATYDKRLGDAAQAIGIRIVEL